MSHQDDISSKDVEALRRFDSCTLSNAIELLNLRPRNEGYMRGHVAPCMFAGIPPVAGFAVTEKMRSASQPVHGHYYYDHVEWWRYVASAPPRIIVMLDADEPAGAGALFGELHARISMALNCVAYISNGAVRDVHAIEKLAIATSPLKIQAAVFHDPDVRYVLDPRGGDLSQIQLASRQVFAQTDDLRGSLDVEGRRLRNLFEVRRGREKCIV